MKSQLQHLWQKLLQEPIKDLKSSCLQWPNGTERILALEVLAQRPDISDKDALDTLLDPRLFHNSDEHVRWVIVSALGKRWPQAALEPLVSALGDPSWLVRQHALQAIEKAIKRLWVQGQACQDVQSLLDTVLPHLFFLLRQSLKEVRRPVEEAVVSFIHQFGMPLVDQLEVLFRATRSFQKASLLRALSLGLLKRRLTRDDEQSHSLLRLGQLLQEACLSHHVTVRRACADAVCAALAHQTQTSPERPSPHFEKVWLKLMADPQASVRASALKSEAILYVLDLGKVRGPAFWDRTMTEEGLVKLLKTLSTHNWAQEAQQVRIQGWFEIGLHFLSHISFTVRRSARGLIDALAPMVTGQLSTVLSEEISLGEEDAALAKTLTRLLKQKKELGDSTMGSGTLRGPLVRWLQVASLVGGWQCVKILKETDWPPAYQSAVARCWLSIAQRLFTCRSLAVVLWKIPENLQGGPTLSKTLDQLAQHSCPFIARAAKHGV